MKFFKKLDTNTKKLVWIELAVVFAILTLAVARVFSGIDHSGDLKPIIGTTTIVICVFVSVFTGITAAEGDERLPVMIAFMPIVVAVSIAVTIVTGFSMEMIALGVVPFAAACAFVVVPYCVNIFHTMSSFIGECYAVIVIITVAQHFIT